MDHPAEPTAEDCTAHTRFEWNGRQCMAIWYPQMGGYSGKAVVSVDPVGCFDTWVWHDGEFPFSDDGYEFGGRVNDGPNYLHHCDPTQFVSFGEALNAMQDSLEEPEQE